MYDPKKFFIVNMSPREQGGSHWVLVYGNIYFDSFGVPPPLTIAPYVNIFNETEYQDFNSSACGFYCLYVADNIYAGKTPEGDLLDSNLPNEDNEAVLRKYFDSQIGAGFFDRFKTRKAESKRLRKFLDGTGSQKVMKVEIARRPVQGAITKVADWISLGKFSKMKKKLGYDTIFHNYLLVTLADGKVYRVEKNHVVEAEPAAKDDFKFERSNVTLTKDTSLKEMIDTASKGDESFWKYRAAKENCQAFTRDVLERNGLKPDQPPEIQDAKQLVETIPLGDTIPNIVTDAAARLDTVIHGGSLNLGRWY